MDPGIHLGNRVWIATSTAPVEGREAMDCHFHRAGRGPGGASPSQRTGELAEYAEADRQADADEDDAAYHLAAVAEPSAQLGAEFQASQRHRDADEAEYQCAGHQVDLIAAEGESHDEVVQAQRESAHPDLHKFATAAWSFPSRGAGLLA